MDEYTEKYMEDNVEVFPESSIALVINKIKSGAHAFPSLQDYVINLMKRLDKNGDGVLCFDEFRSGLEGMDIHLTEQEVHTMVRKFDHNQDGRISMEEFYNTLAAY
jgi:Ca2+-binding EF-hand superfamily protein